ncbi:MAG: hypothetical protein WA461_09435, partial [Nitrososphaeraceae archaeon]
MIWSRYALILTVLSILAGYSFCTPYWLYAQELITNKSPLQNATSGLSLDVLLEPIPFSVKANDSSAKFKVSFLKMGTSTLQEHVD